MRLANDVKRDLNAIKQVRMPWWGWLCVYVGTGGSVLLFHHFGRSNLLFPTLASILGLGTATAVKWGLRRHVWFWGVLSILAGLHVALIVLLPWAVNKGPAIQIVGMAGIDWIIIFAVLDAAERFVERRQVPRT